EEAVLGLGEPPAGRGDPAEQGGAGGVVRGRRPAATGRGATEEDDAAPHREMTLDHDPASPFEVIASHEIARDWNLALRRDRVRWPDGTEADSRVVEGPEAVFVVPYSQSGTTILVRQWRHTWRATSWEVPAGTLEPGEEPLACAQRELREEAGLMADEWTSLGATRGTAVL